MAGVRRQAGQVDGDGDAWGASVTLMVVQATRHPLGREATTAASHCPGTDGRGLGFPAA